MNKHRSLPRRMAMGLMEHAAWVFPSARGPWATAMRNELAQIENDLEALTWAGGCLAASYVERGRAVSMHLQRWKTIGSIAVLAMGALLAASRWIGQRPFITPGSNQVLRMDSNAGGIIGFAASFLLVPATIVGLFSFFSCIQSRDFHSEAARRGRVCMWMVMPCLAALMLVSMLTPRTIVSIGDGYCWDLWCLGVEQVNATPQGQNTLYTAKVRLFSDANRVPTSRAKNFLYAIDEQGRRFPVFQNRTALPLDVTLHPGQSLTTSLSFLAPANAVQLYLTGDHVAMPWVYLYPGSDLNPLHRRTLVRIL
jgi:hypothetical protein